MRRMQKISAFLVLLCMLVTVFPYTASAETTLKITSQPQNAIVDNVNDTAVINIAAVGDGITYKWYYKDRHSANFVASSAKTATYSYAVTEARDGRQV